MITLIEVLELLCKKGYSISFSEATALVHPAIIIRITQVMTTEFNSIEIPVDAPNNHKELVIINAIRNILFKTFHVTLWN